MSRDFFSNKWVLGGIVFLIVFSVACVFWYRYDTAPYRKSAAKTDEIIRKWDAASKKEKPGDMSQNVHQKTTSESLEVNVKKTTSENIEDNNSQNVVSLRNRPLDTLTSPYGFGPYPEIPIDFPIDRMPPWTWTDEKRQKMMELSNVPDILRDGELIYRVYIKMWNEGGRILPAAKVDPITDRIYLMYPNTVYVTYDYIENPDGTRERFISSTEAYGVEVGVDITKEDILNNNIPQHISVKTFDENIGIDPYSYLGIKP